MEIILRRTIDTLGEEGDIVKVKPGYGRNYLIPQNQAVMATKINLTILEREKSVIEARKTNQRQGAEALAAQFADITVVIEQRTGEDNKLYGSVTSADIAAKLAELDLEVDKKKIILDEPIKTLGEFIVPIKAGYQVKAEVKVNVVPLASKQEK